MSRNKLAIALGILILIGITSCCKDTEVIKYENPNLVFSIYSSLSKELTTVYKNNNKIKRISINNPTYYDNVEFFSNDAFQSVWSIGTLENYNFSYKNKLSKDTLVFKSAYDTILYIFENEKLKQMKMARAGLFVINNYSNTLLDISLMSDDGKIKKADYKLILDTGSYQDFYPQSFYEFMPPLNYLRYYTDFYDVKFPKLSYKSISIKLNPFFTLADDITIKNEFNSKGRISKSYIIRSKYPIRNDTLSFNYFD